MRDKKLVASIRDAIISAGLKDGMTISFHHHMRNGDYVLNMVMDEIAAMGFKGLTLNATALFDIHLPLIDHIKNGVVTTLMTNYMSAGLGKQICAGVMENPVQFRTHGTRPDDIVHGRTPIDIAFVAAPQSDDMGNCTGKYGKSACGSFGYAIIDAQYAKKTVVITDELVEYPMVGFTVPEVYVDYVVVVDAIGDPNGIVSGTTRITRDPVGLVMAQTAAKVVEHSGLLVDGFSFQTGAGGATLAGAKYLKDIMLAKGIKGSYVMGGITKYLVEMLQAGCFKTILDGQTFDLDSIDSLRNDPRHQEVSLYHYAGPNAPSCIVNSLDTIFAGATEIDTDFNVNVHTDSNGIIMGGSGGHSDICAGAKMSVIITPMFRNRLPMIRDRVTTITTPGNDIDVVVTQGGVAVNPKNVELRERLKAAGLPIVDIYELQAKAERMTGKPQPIRHGDKVVAEVIYRDGTVIDRIYNTL